MLYVVVEMNVEYRFILFAIISILNIHEIYLLYISVFD